MSDDTLNESSVALPMREVGLTVAIVERTLILDTLAYCNGNRTHAAHVLGISVRTLRNKLNQYAAEGVSVPPALAAKPAAAA
jgi:two-component system, response regulator FlrC